MWIVYILKCSDETFYTGITNNLPRRLKQHNTSNSIGAKYTRTRRPVSVMYTEEALNRSVASVRERAIKRWPRSKKMALAKVKYSEAPYINTLIK